MSVVAFEVIEGLYELHLHHKLAIIGCMVNHNDRSKVIGNSADKYLAIISEDLFNHSFH